MSPERNRVTFGCVRLKGDVDTEATDIEVPSRSSGNETMNGRRGTDRLKVAGIGLMTDAIACNAVILDFEDTLKDLRVMKSEAEGKGTSFPG